MSTLYREYRPDNFSQILGQNHIKVTLQNELASGKLAQAFLFCGPRAVGKTTMARVLAKAANCQARRDGDSEPCGCCASCESIKAGRNLDVVEIDAASNTGVDNVRENIISFSRLAPGQSKFKVFIIDEVHMLSVSAFNALLKIIEEPPTHVIFILCTTEVHKVPATVISRCERFDFKRISSADVIRKLGGIVSAEKVEVDQAVLEAIASRSNGHLRDAESLLGQVLALGGKKISLEQAELVIPRQSRREALEIIERTSRKEAAKAIAFLNQALDSGVSPKNLAAEVVALLRQLVLGKLNPGLAESLGLSLGEGLDLKLNGLAESIAWPQLIAMSRRFIAAAEEIKSASIPQLPLELAIAEISLLSLQLPDSGSGRDDGNLPPEPVRRAAPQAPKPTPSAPKKTSPAAKLDLDEVAEKWPEFLAKIKKYNHSLSFVLQNCQPQRMSDGCLTLAFKYKFHQDRINSSGIKEIMERTLAEVFGASLKLDSLLDESLQLKREPLQAQEAVSEEVTAPAKAEDGGTIGDILKVFGGEVVN